MADEKKEHVQLEENTEAKADTGQIEKSGSIIQWIVMGVILIIMMTFGFFLGHFLGSPPKEAQARQEEEIEESREKKEDSSENLFTKNSKNENKNSWFYDLPPVATNLKDTGSTRYVRAALTLEIVPEADESKTREFLDKKKKPIITNILNIYFAGLSVEDINSDKDLRRIQYELINLLNENLGPDSKPLIKQILFQEFGVQ